MRFLIITSAIVILLGAFFLNAWLKIGKGQRTVYFNNITTAERFKPYNDKAHAKLISLLKNKFGFVDSSVRANYSRSNSNDSRFECLEGRYQESLPFQIILVSNTGNTSSGVCVEVDTWFYGYRWTVDDSQRKAHAFGELLKDLWTEYQASNPEKE